MLASVFVIAMGWDTAILARAAYYVDATAQVRFHHFGEGRYDDQDVVIRSLLEEAGK